MDSINTLQSLVEVYSKRPAVHPDFLEIEVYPASEDFRLFRRMVNQGIDSHLEGFTLSKFGYMRYESIGVRAYFNFHRSEIPILVRRLRGIFDPYLDHIITYWLEFIETHKFD